MSSVPHPDNGDGGHSLKKRLDIMPVNRESSSGEQHRRARVQQYDYSKDLAELGSAPTTETAGNSSSNNMNMVT
jgi:hypothetical protein